MEDKNLLSKDRPFATKLYLALHLQRCIENKIKKENNNEKQQSQERK